MYSSHPSHRQAGNSKLPFIIAAVIVLLLIAVWYFNRGGDEQKPEPKATAVEEPAPVREPPPEPAPDIPKAPPPAPEEKEEPLPPLPESDPVVRQELQGLSERERYSEWLKTEHLVQKAAAITEGLSRGVILRKVLPLTPPSEPFQVKEEDDTLMIDPASYRRYDPLVATLTSIDPVALAGTFHRFRPLLEEAYGELGQPGDQVDNTLISAIDRVLATPDVQGDVELVQESVYYQFADPKLESLPPVQKQMLRLGPENRAEIKAYLRQLRTALMELEQKETNTDSD